jgi:hypothetical protein
MDLTKIEHRLKASTEGPWSVVQKGGAVVSEHLKADGTRPIYPADDDCIVGPMGEEVLGSSERLRAEPEDLLFMAHAKQDIQDLLNEIKRLKEASS